jgi:hypothetical protein
MIKERDMYVSVSLQESDKGKGKKVEAWKRQDMYR